MLIGVSVRKNKNSIRGKTITLYWDTADGSHQEYAVLESGREHVIRARPIGYIHGVLETRVRDDEGSRCCLFSVRRGTVEPFSPSRRETKRTLNIVDTKATVVAVIEIRVLRKKTKPTVRTHTHQIPLCGSSLLERYDNVLADQFRSSNERPLQSNGLLVDIMRTTMHITVPYRTRTNDPESLVPRWYFVTEGMQIAYQNTPLSSYEAIAASVRSMWVLPPGDGGGDDLSLREHMLVGAQMCQTHHAWSHYVTDMAGPNMYHSADTWNNLRGTASPGTFGKDCDDGAIETNATFYEMLKISKRGVSGGHMESARLLVRTYCCMMVMCTIRPTGLSTPDGIPAGAEPSLDPIHRTHENLMDAGSPSGKIEDTEAPTRALHMYCMLVHWDAIRQLVGPEHSERIPRVPRGCESPGKHGSCDTIMIMESTETFASDSALDEEVYGARRVLSEIAEHPGLQGAVRVPSSHKLFSIDDFYRANIVCYSQQLLKRTGVAVWDFTVNEDGPGEPRVGAGHAQLMSAAAAGPEHLKGRGFGLRPHVPTVKKYRGGSDSSGGGVRYFIDTARIQKSLPEFVSDNITARPVWPLDRRADPEKHRSRIPVWCTTKYADKCEDIIEEMCMDDASPIEGCDRIDFGKLGVAFACTISNYR